MDEENTEKKITTKAYNESYFMFQKLISELFIIPLIIYILIIAYITHISTFNQPLKSHINLYLAKKRKFLYLILILLYIGHMISILRVSNLETSASSISNSITLIILLFYIMDIMAVLLTIYFIEEKNKKQIKINKQNPLQIFIVFNIIYFLLALVNEIVYGRFTFLTPVTFCYLIYFQIFYYQYPNDIEHLFLSSGAKFIAVSEYYKGLINQKKSSIKTKEEINRVTNNKKYIPMGNLSGRISMLGSDSNYLNNENNNNNDNRRGSNESNNKINKLINNLYDPNNIDYLQNSYEGILNISVKFQSNFFIDYGTYYNHKNKEKDNNMSDKDLPLLNNNQYENESNSDDKFDVANFYTSIIFNFNVIATSSYYVTNKNLSKSLDEFFQLDNIIENEFTIDRYSPSLIKNLPKLNIKKCFENLTINAKKGFDVNSFSDNSDILLDCIQNTKNICEKYLKDIISNPHFIIPEVLIFLEIKDKNVIQIYININQQIKKEDNNLLRRLSRQFDNSGYLISSNPNYKFVKNEFNNKINLKILKGDFIDDNKNKKDKKNINNYFLLISLTYEECTKYVRKKLEETIFILQEFNKVLFINNKNNNFNKIKNTKKDYNINITKHFSEFIKIYNNLNGTNFAPNQSFKLKNNKNNEDIFKSYSPSEKNKEENDLFYHLISCLENLLHLLINYYLEEIYNSNQIIKEYFIDFIEDYWSTDNLKNYIKYDNNFINLFQNEINSKNINSIFVLDKHYLFININYNINVFYLLYFKITTNTNFIQIEKKYSFDEVKNYIDLMKVELGLSLVWPKRCFELEDEDRIENIHIYRLSLMSTYLNKIFNANKIFNIKNWNKIFFDDKLYHEVCEIKFKEKKVKGKKSEEIFEKKNSIDDFFWNGSNKKIRNDIIKNGNNINENMTSFELRKSDLLNDENESMNSFGSLTSNISKNSNVKKLLDI